MRQINKILFSFSYLTTKIIMLDFMNFKHKKKRNENCLGEFCLFDFYIMFFFLGKYMQHIVLCICGLSFFLCSHNHKN